MTGAGPPPQGEPPAAPPDDAPASVGQLRTLRRWVAVAGVWAVAATAVALIALLDDGGDAEPRDDSGDVATEIGQLQRSVNERLGEIEQQVEEAGSAEDLQRLDQRLQDVEDDVSSAADSAAEAADAVEGLSTRLDELESRVETLDNEGGGGGDEP